jgi:alpha-1,6-mannosyltransferase
MALGGIGYLLTLRELRRKPHAQRHRVIAIVAACALALVAAYGFRFIFSSDAYAYAAYGGLAATGADPYVHRTFPPAQLVNADWTATIGFEWPSLPACIYGPAFVALAQAVVVATHFDLAHALVALRVLEMAAFVCAIALAAILVPQRGALLAAAIGLNPVVISTVADGHNDALILLIAALAVLIAYRRPELGGFIAGLSATLKATGAAVALALAYASGNRRFLGFVVAGIAAALVVQLIGTRLAGGYQTAAATDFVGTGAAAVAMGLRGLLALALALRTLYCAGRGRRAAALAAGALLIWALYPQNYPWYGVWLLPLAAFTLEQREGRVLVALTFTSTLRYLSDAYGYAPAAPWLELTALAIPLAGMLAHRGKPLPT